MMEIEIKHSIVKPAILPAKICPAIRWEFPCRESNARCSAPAGWQAEDFLACQIIRFLCVTVLVVGAGTKGDSCEFKRRQVFCLCKNASSEVA
jgi:hypothetical protein